MADDLNRISISEDQLSLLAICSERYALGRMTYVVGDVCCFIRGKLKQLPKSTLSILIDDISNPLCGNYGMEVDKREWDWLLDDLRQEYANRLDNSEEA